MRQAIEVVRKSETIENAAKKFGVPKEYIIYT